ncbi:MAG TPA: HAD-IIIA family hydrolase [Candidatus Lambdaproteobacteria bacterium]|nr:HAD-IIIA family hydrolase [Candidatus Lambdaproteobacteria bacterium]HIB45995.1 HAD-IIIA family hydrolase [Candidatus Lambdaproteobacteria bacterium]HIO11910.1 HAD-IIIA family hydrolase [Deltaproteobacteria bacterium]
MLKYTAKKLRVILLDRDGVINQEPGPILTPEQFVMIPKSAAAVARLNAKGWQCFVITNQAAFARGDLSETVFQTITAKMGSELEKSGAHIDGQYYCPHHPDWKNGQRRKEPKPCACRKPGTLLLEQAAAEHGFSAAESVLIGDSIGDFAAAAKWGTCSIGVRTGHAGQDGKASAEPDYWKADLWDAVEFLLENSS